MNLELYVSILGEKTMNLCLEKLIEKFRDYQMSPKEKEKQKISFAFGNTSIENPHITKRLVKQINQRLKKPGD